MKLNEKMLSNLATSYLSPIDKEGWLIKRGEQNKNFQKRWFVLKGNLLFYFEKKFDKDPIGVIVLEGCTVELAEDEDFYCFKIVFSGPNSSGFRTYILGTDSQDDAEGWMKSITCASYDYLKVMVAELQRQVDELTDLEKVQRQAKVVVSPTTRVNPFMDTPVLLQPKNFQQLHNLFGKEIFNLRNKYNEVKEVQHSTNLIDI